MRYLKIGQTDSNCPCTHRLKCNTTAIVINYHQSLIILSWNLSLLRRETENSYTSTAFSEDIPGTLGPFNIDLDRTNVLNCFKEIIPLIAQSSIRFRSVLQLSAKPEDTLIKAAEIGQKIFSSLTEEVKQAIISSRNLHIFTDDLDLPWTLLHDGTDFVALKHPMGISSSKKQLHSDKSQVSGKLHVLLVVDSKEDLPHARFEIQRILHIFSTNTNVEYVLLDLSYGQHIVEVIQKVDDEEIKGSSTFVKATIENFDENIQENE